MVSADNKWLLLAERVVDEWAEITFPRPVVTLEGFEQFGNTLAIACALAADV